MSLSLFTVLIPHPRFHAQCSDDAIPCRAERLAAALNAPLSTSDRPLCAKFVVAYTETGQLELRFGQEPAVHPIRSDLRRRRRTRGADPLLRAIGSERCDIIDVTAGLGADATSLAVAGHHVTAVEEHPLLYALLEDGWRHLTDAELASRLCLIHADSIAWLDNRSQAVDVIYLDPMYPPRQGKAVSKKGIRLIQDLIPYRPERDRALLKVARRRARRRVIVKRPLHAHPLLPGKSGDTKGKLVRFDIYPPVRDNA